jgi:uncharacterized Tic20 family protein
MNQTSSDIPAAAKVQDKDARNWGMICHLAALSGYIIPFGNVIGPLIVWAMKKDEYPFVDDQGKEALNFQLTMSIVGLVGILMIFTIIFAVIAIPLLAALCIFMLVMIIVASIKANEGVPYRYPLTIRFFK